MRGSQEFEITVRNLGTVAAENVILSFKAGETNFDGFSSLPYLANRLTSNKTSQGSDLGCG
jgi:hypothetical protein